MADKRFLTLAEVQEILNVSPSQAYALVRGGDLPAIQIGGRGIWRVETRLLEAYIASRYDAVRRRNARADPPSSPTDEAGRQ